MLHAMHVVAEGFLQEAGLCQQWRLSSTCMALHHAETYCRQCEVRAPHAWMLNHSPLQAYHSSRIALGLVSSDGLCRLA